eukprot:9098854-Alexandrium_andersonii.AAC.1
MTKGDGPDGAKAAASALSAGDVLAIAPTLTAAAARCCCCAMRDALLCLLSLELDPWRIVRM